MSKRRLDNQDLLNHKVKAVDDPLTGEKIPINKKDGIPINTQIIQNNEENNNDNDLDDLDDIDDIDDIEIKTDNVVEKKKDTKEWIEFWKYRTKDKWWYLRKYITQNQNGDDVSVNEIVDRNLSYNQYVTFLRKNYGINNDSKVQYVSGKQVFKEQEKSFREKKSGREVKYTDYILSFKPDSRDENNKDEENENENEYQHSKENEVNTNEKTIDELVRNVDKYIENDIEFKERLGSGLDIIPEIYFYEDGRYINLDHYLESFFLGDIITQDLGINDQGNVIFEIINNIQNDLIDKENELRMKYKRAYEKDRRKGIDTEKYEIDVPIRLISSEIEVELDKDIPNYENNLFTSINYNDIPRTKQLFAEDSRMYWFVIRFGGYFKHLLYTDYFFNKRDELLKNSYTFLKNKADGFISGIDSGKIKRDGDFYEYFDDLYNKKYKFYADFINSLRENKDYKLKKAYSLEYDPNVILRSDKKGDEDYVNIGHELYYLINPLKREVDNIWKSIINGLKYRRDFVQVFPVLNNYYMNSLKKTIRSNKIFEGKQFIYNPVYYYLSKQYGNNPIVNRFSIRTREEEYKHGQNNSITISQTVDNTTYYKTITWILLYYDKYILGLKELFKTIQIEDTKNDYGFEDTLSTTNPSKRDIILHKVSKKTIFVSRLIQTDSNSQMNNLPRKDQPI